MPEVPAVFSPEAAEAIADRMEQEFLQAASPAEFIAWCINKKKIPAGAQIVVHDVWGFTQ